MRRGTLEKRWIDCLDHLAEGDFIRRSAQKIPASLATATFHQPGAAKIVQDLHQEISGYCFALR